MLVWKNWTLYALDLRRRHMPDSIMQRFLGGRSIFAWIFGTFFSDSTNTSGLLAIGLVTSIIYLYVRNGQVPDRLLDAVFIIVGFYGGATAKKADPNAQP
jgi:hypothetical protein